MFLTTILAVETRVASPVSQCTLLRVIILGGDLIEQMVGGEAGGEVNMNHGII